MPVLVDHVRRGTTLFTFTNFYSPGLEPECIHPIPACMQRAPTSVAAGLFRLSARYRCHVSAPRLFWHVPPKGGRPAPTTTPPAGGGLLRPRSALIPRHSSPSAASTVTPPFPIRAVAANSSTSKQAPPQQHEGGGRGRSAAAAAAAAIKRVPVEDVLPGCGYEAPSAAYIHIPFCRRRCYYCDFPSAS